jgi:hypothetical protein
MAKQDINYGTADNSGDGDPLRTAFRKSKENFDELYQVLENSITGAESLAATDLGYTHILTGTSSDYTIDLPTAVGNTGGAIAFKGSNALTKVVTVAGVSGQEIDGRANHKIAKNGLVVLVSNGVDWDIVNEVGSWIAYTPVWTGFSVDPTVAAAEYFKQGDWCTVRIACSGNGTSNATTTTMTVPFNAATNNVQYGLIPIVVNNAALLTAPGRIDTRQTGSNVLDMYTTVAGAAWTASSGKRVSFTFTYKIE